MLDRFCYPEIMRSSSTAYRSFVALSLGSEQEAQRRIPLMRVGDWARGPSGSRVQITPAMLAEAKANFDGWEHKQLPIDIQHYSTEPVELVPDPLATRAVGWVSALSIEGDTLWGDVEWTAEGAQLVGSKAFRFISPTFYPQSERGAYLTAAAITNTPVLDMPAIAARDGGEEESTMTEQEILALRESASRNEAELVALRVRAEKSDAEAVALRESVAKAESELVALRDQKQALATEVDQYRGEKRVALRDRFFGEGRLSPAQWDSWGKALAERDVADFERICASMPAALATQGSAGAVTAADDKAPKSYDEAFALAETAHPGMQARQIAAIVARENPGLLADYVETRSAERVGLYDLSR